MPSTLTLTSLPNRLWRTEVLMSFLTRLAAGGRAVVDTSDEIESRRPRSDPAESTRCRFNFLLKLGLDDCLSRLSKIPTMPDSALTDFITTEHVSDELIESPKPT